MGDMKENVFREGKKKKKKHHPRILALQLFNSFSQWQTETEADAFEVQFNLREDL